MDDIEDLLQDEMETFGTNGNSEGEFEAEVATKKRSQTDGTESRVLKAAKPNPGASNGPGAPAEAPAWSRRGRDAGGALSSHRMAASEADELGLDTEEAEALLLAAGSPLRDGGGPLGLLSADGPEDVDVLGSASALEASGLGGLSPLLRPREPSPPALSALDVPGESAAVTSSERGGMAFCAVRDAPRLSHRSQAALLLSLQQQQHGEGGPLCGRRLDDLLAEVEEARLQRALEATRPGARAGAPAQSAAGGDLWVDKYSPSSYMELLSDEQTNREVLRWIKAWDPTVFGVRGDGGGAAETGAAGIRRFAEKGPAAADSRPTPRVLLISGPPGVGKTTLVHILARHCGYRPVEVNASDDRSAGALGQRVQDAVTMQPVLGERKPNLVVVDEVDGAAGGAEGRSAVKALLRIVNDGGAAAANEGGKQQRRRRILSRPIICICNDPYVPALRPLRDAAELFVLRPPKAEKLVARLSAVCAAEGLRAARGALAALVERSGSDIRSCLNTLQLLSRKHSVISPETVDAAQVASKDVEQSAFRVWEEIFFLPLRPSRLTRAAETPAERSARKLRTINSFGDTDIILAGCHENMLGMRYHETGLSRTTAMVSWMADCDRLATFVRRRSDFSVACYLPPCAVAVGSLCASSARVRLRWPRADSESRQRAVRGRELAAGWMAGWAPAARSGLSPRAALTDVLPALLRVLLPDMRALSPHLMAPADRERLGGIVERLIAYGLTFDVGREREDRGIETVLPLVPPVDKLAAFPGIEHGEKAPPDEAIRQVAHQVSLESIRRSSKKKSIGSANPEPPQSAASTAESSSGPAAQTTVSSAPLKVSLGNLIKEAAPRNTSLAASVAKPKGNWLDSMRKDSLRKRSEAASGAAAKMGVAGQKTSQALRGKHGPVLYKFHEGYTNAVKRVLKMSDLLSL